jgi:putative methyltransferase (TIGR04325 family)
MQNNIIWDGVYQSFVEAEIACKNNFNQNIWDEELWVNKQIDKIKSIKSNQESFINEDNETNDYILPVIISSFGKSNNINILDFGGGLGEQFYKTKDFCLNFDRTRFTILENQKLVSIGNNSINEENLYFTTEFPKDFNFDIVHFGSSFHYINDWKELLKNISSLNPKFIIFSDLPCSENESFVTVQNYNGNKIPVRFLNIFEFISELKNNKYDLIFKSKFKSKYLANLDNFEDKYKLKYFSQLCFKNF